MERRLCPRVSHKAAGKVSAKTQSHLKAQLQENPLPSSLAWWWEGFISSPDMGLRVSVPHWLFGLQFLTTWASPQGEASPQGSLLCPKQTNKEHG